LRLRARRRPVRGPALAACAAGAVIAVLAAGRARAQDDEWFESPGASREQVGEALRALWGEHHTEFVALVAGAAVGVVVAGAIHAVWRRRPTAGRVMAPVALAVATAMLLGLILVHGRVNDAVVGAGISWFLLAAMIAVVFRTPVVAPKREALPWMRVGARPARKRSAQEREPSAEKKEDEERDGHRAALAAAEVAVDEALARLDAGEIDAAVEGLTRSLEARPTKSAHTYLATILGARGEREAALAEIERALALDPDYSEALDEKARLLDGLGRGEEAQGVRARLRDVRGRLRRQAGAARPEPPSACPACGKDVPAGADACECGLDLRKCSRCGRDGLVLRPLGEDLVCGECRAKAAASHARGRDRLAAVRESREVPPWMAAAAFAAAVVAGAALSPAVVAWREGLATNSLAGYVDLVASQIGADAAGAAADDARRLTVADLDRRRQAILWRHAFVRGRPAVLNAMLAVHALGVARDLAPGEPELAGYAYEWASRRIEQAREALAAGDRTDLKDRFSGDFLAQRGQFDIEIDKRKLIAADLVRRAAERAALERSARVPRDWRGIWSRPKAGTSFLVEVYRRVNPASGLALAAVGFHPDGAAPLAPTGLLRCTVLPSRDGSGGDFVLRMESIDFDIETLDEPPDGMPPAVRLVPKEGRRDSGAYRLEFAPNLEFKLLAGEPGTQGAEEGAPEVLVTSQSMYVPRQLPYVSLPFFAPGLGESWEQDEKLLWPYPGADPARGPCVKQETRWSPLEPTGVRVDARWHLRYQPASAKYEELIVQKWVAGSPWWHVYDNGVMFFRAVFGPTEGGDDE